ncbi:minor tail protein [Arthrobacter phage MamaPearl]|uniref:Minor tail protein n=1 Tax=Arthrobacter phage MamaPearl TaxID=2743906 RepID=A0AAE7K5Q1_9CAUD|nr:minor tail protein [Arthrobacter phage MamaPearl]QDH48203.1 minor tail protein [Arthrobacter phage EstebanJulior]QKY79085.1 minor tail protein [Arthrobacter phage MamaPearl]
MTDNMLVAATSATLELTTGQNVQWGAPGDGSQLFMNKIKGWHGSSPIRRDKSDRLGAHGSHSERGWKDERLIELHGSYTGTSPLDAEMKIEELAGLFGDGTKGRFTTNSALGMRWADVYLAGDGFDPVWTGRAQFSFVIFMLAPDPRKYGSSIWSPEVGIPTEGGGLRFDLFSGQWDLSRTNYATNPLPYNPVTTDLYATNHVVNPDFEAGISSWTQNNATATVISSFPQMTKSGSNIVQVVSDGTATVPGISMVSASYRPAVTAGQWVAFGAFMATENGGYETRVQLNWRDSAGATISNTASTYTATPFYTGGQQVHVAQAPAGAASVGYFLQFRDGVNPGVPVPAGKRMWADSVRLFISDYEYEVTRRVNEPFFCGATTNDDFIYAWAGTANLSVSTKSAPITPAGWSYFNGTGEVGDSLWRSIPGSDGRAGIARREVLVPKVSGSTGWQYQENVSGTTDDTWSGSMVLNPPNTLTSKLRISFYNGSTLVNFVDSANQTITGNVDTTVTVTGTATGPFTNIRLWYYLTTGNTPANGDFDASRALLEPTEFLGPWFDGNSQDGASHDYGWNGVTEASTSYDLVPRVPSTVGILDFGVNGNPGTATLVNNGTADTGPKFTIKGTSVPGFTITHLGTGRRLKYDGTIRTGQTLVIDADNGSVLLDGYAPRELAVAEWTRLGRGESATYLFESVGSIGATMKVEVRPAWW